MANIAELYKSAPFCVEQLTKEDKVIVLSKNPDEEDNNLLTVGEEYKVHEIEIDCYGGDDGCDQCPTFGTCVTVINNCGETHHSCYITLSNTHGVPLRSIYGDFDGMVKALWNYEEDDDG